MKMPILIVDDSPMARKMLIKALPPEWNVEISQAGNGWRRSNSAAPGKRR
jgi:chemotaxis response regulator CheB